MGSLLFERTSRLSETNHVYESFNADGPDLIAEVHLAYLAAGAQCLKTNTFGANREALRAYGLETRVADFNSKGARLARDMIVRFQTQRGLDGPFFVLGSIGPTGTAIATPAGVKDAYQEQIESLIAGGVDALVLETFSSLEQLQQVLDCVQALPGAPPIVAEMTIPSSGAAPLAGFDAAGFVERMHARHVAVAGVNCCAPWDASAFVEAVKECPVVRSGAIGLSAMPNGGGFQRIANRFMSFVNPEYVGKLARTLADQGVRLLGGCCEVHPPHIREMHSYLHARQAGGRAPGVQPVAAALSPVGDAKRRQNGRFSRKLLDGQFVVSVEVVPPRGTDPKAGQAKLDFIRRLAEGGLVDAVDVTDGSRGIALTPPGDFIQLTRQQLGWSQATGDRLELIPHFTARDLNVMGVQSRLVGYHVSRIHNVLFITGDPPKMSPTYPRSTGVFDLDSIAMIRLARSCLNAGVDFGGSPLGKQADPRMHFTIGTGFEPEALNLQRELARLEQKIAAGADYVMTQPAFRHEPLGPVEKHRDACAFLVGVMILRNLEHAQRVKQIPGVVIPDTILERLAQFDRPDDQAKVGRDLAVEQLQWVRRTGWDGVYLMSPGGSAAVLSVLQGGFASPCAKTNCYPIG
jgi:homocysteine S-methyltransferase